MRIESKKLDANKRELNIEVSGDIVKNKFEDVFVRLGKEAKVPGFRPGHVPRDILEKHYAAHAHDLVIKELIPDIYNQAIEKESLDVIELPDITDVKLDRVTLSFRATVELSPQIILKDYKGLAVTHRKVTVTPEEVKRSIDALKESRKIDTLDDNFSRGLGFFTLQELEEALTRQLYLEKENQARQKIENDIIEAVTKDLDFKVPQALVKRQLDDLLRQTKVDLALKGAPREKIEEQEKQILEELEPIAKRQVKVYLVLSEIAKKENVPLNDHMPARVVEFLLRNARWQEAA